MATNANQVPTISGPAGEQFFFGPLVQNWLNLQPNPLFLINKIEDTRQHLKLPLPPHRKEVFDFIFLTKGETQRSKGLNQFHVRANTFFFLPAHQISSHEFYSEDARGYYCFFHVDLLTQHLASPAFLDQFAFLQFSGHPLVSVKSQQLRRVLFILQRLVSEQATIPPNYSLISAYLITLFLELQSSVVSSPNVKEKAPLWITQQYKQTLAKYIYEKQLVTEYADLLSLSPTYLNRCVKATLGRSAHDLLSDMILLEAKVLLRQTNWSVSEIAFRLRKQDTSDFTRFFKRMTGLTPSQYRYMV